jgi:uncharacterized membrane protein (DUF485 family)
MARVRVLEELAHVHVAVGRIVSNPPGKTQVQRLYSSLLWQRHSLFCRIWVDLLYFLFLFFCFFLCHFGHDWLKIDWHHALIVWGIYCAVIEAKLGFVYL